jgi:hypothetical protein
MTLGFTTCRQVQRGWLVEQSLGEARERHRQSRSIDAASGVGGCRSFGWPYSAAMRSHAISRYSSLSPARRGGGVRIMRSPSKCTPRT